MKPLRRQTLADQTADHLREGLLSGRWLGRLPGVGRLAVSLDVSKDTVRAALRLLEQQGAIQAAGAGRSRRITGAGEVSPTGAGQRTLSIGVLLNMQLEEDNAHSQRLILRLVREIERAGHECFIAEKSLVQLGFQPKRVGRVVKDLTADGWIVYAGSYEVLQWFVKNQIPVLALGGRPLDLPVAVARTDTSQAVNSAVDALVALQHRRIVLVCPRLWMEPVRHPTAEAFMKRLAHHGLPASSYNLPDWNETALGLQSLLEALFLATPPTAMLFLEPAYTVAGLAFLAQRGLRVPEDVSVISMLPDPAFAMRCPSMATFEWPLEPLQRRLMRWVNELVNGRVERESKVAAATFVPGGTIGPAKTGL